MYNGAELSPHLPMTDNFINQSTLFYVVSCFKSYIFYAMSTSFRSTSFPLNHHHSFSEVMSYVCKEVRFLCYRLYSIQRSFSLFTVLCFQCKYIKVHFLCCKFLEFINAYFHVFLTTVSQNSFTLLKKKNPLFHLLNSLPSSSPWQPLIYFVSILLHFP